MNEHGNLVMPPGRGFKATYLIACTFDKAIIVVSTIRINIQSFCIVPRENPISICGE
jgi:hypothetical protein